MSSQARTSREEERRLSVRTLAIASASSAAAAIVTSRLWAAGTPIAAAMTPVIVTIVSEMLHRPAEKIVERFTTETDALPEAAGAGPPPPAAEEEDAAPAREQPGRGPRDRERPAAGADGVRVYRPRNRVLPWKLVAATAALAFVIGIAVLSLPQLIAGESVIKGNPPLYDSASKGRANEDNDPQQAPSPVEEQPGRTVPEQTAPEETETEPQPTTTTPAPQEPPAGQPAPQQTAPVPAPQPDLRP